MLLIFLSGKTKITGNKTGFSPRNGSLIFYIIFILSSPLNLPANYLNPISEHKSKVTKQRCLQNIILSVYENKCLSRLGRLRRLLSALGMICKEIASCPPKLTDNWEQWGEKDERDYKQMGGMKVFSVCASEPWDWTESSKKGRHGRKKALSSQTIKFGTFSKINPVLLIFTCMSIKDKTITKKRSKKKNKKSIHIQA